MCRRSSSTCLLWLILAGHCEPMPDAAAGGGSAWWKKQCMAVLSVQLVIPCMYCTASMLPKPLGNLMHAQPVSHAAEPVKDLSDREIEKLRLG